MQDERVTFVAGMLIEFMSCPETPMKGPRPQETKLIERIDDGFDRGSTAFSDWWLNPQERPRFVVGGVAAKYFTRALLIYHNEYFICPKLCCCPIGRKGKYTLDRPFFSPISFARRKACPSKCAAQASKALQMKCLSFCLRRQPTLQ